MSSIKKNKIDQYKINDKTPINSGVSGTVILKNIIGLSCN